MYAFSTIPLENRKAWRKFTVYHSPKEPNQRFPSVAEFKSPDVVPEAVSLLNKQQFRGRDINVREETAEARDQNGQPIKIGQNSSSSVNAQLFTNESFGSKETFGIVAKILNQLDLHGPLSRRVFVANVSVGLLRKVLMELFMLESRRIALTSTSTLFKILSDQLPQLNYTVSEKELLEGFVLAGRVVSIEILKSSDGKSRGQAFLEYSHPVEAVQAISMFRGAQFCGRELSIRMDDRKNDAILRKPYPNVINPPKQWDKLGLGLGENGRPLDYPDQLMDVAMGTYPPGLGGSRQSGWRGEGLALVLDWITLRRWDGLDNCQNSSDFEIKIGVRATLFIKLLLSPF